MICISYLSRGVIMKKKSVQKKPASKIKSVNNGTAVSIVKTISILGYIGAGLGILAGLLLLFLGPFILSMLPIEYIPPIIGTLAGAFLIVYL